MEQSDALRAMYETLAFRIGVSNPTKLCDDEREWLKTELHLRTERRKKYRKIVEIHGVEVLQEIHRYIEKNPAANHSCRKLAARVGLSARQFAEFLYEKMSITPASGANLTLGALCGPQR